MRKRNRKKQFWLSEEEERQLRLNAIKVGLSEVEYVRSLIMGYTPKELPPKELYDLILEIRKIGININQIAKKANSTNIIDVNYFKYEIGKLDNIVEHIKNEYLNSTNNMSKN